MVMVRDFAMDDEMHDALDGARYILSSTYLLWEYFRYFYDTAADTTS